RAAWPRPRAPGRTAGDSGPGQRPPPRGEGLFLRWGWRRLVAPGAALPERLRLAAVGQQAARAQARPAVGHHRPEQAADAGGRWQGPALDALALGGVAAGKAPLRVVPIDATVGGDGHTVGRAPARVEPLRRAGHRPLGLAPPLWLE